MPPRRVDRHVVRSRRRAAEITQSDMGDGVGVAGSTVAAWELGSQELEQERLPAVARVLRSDLNELFPRDGLPDLRDLRCDAGLYRKQTAAIIGTRSDGPVAGAEQGVRRLREKYVQPLARAYNVSVEELRQAEERSFALARGEEATAEVASDSSAEEAPSTLQGKINLILERSYPGQAPPSDQELAESVNTYAGKDLVTAQDIERLRTGEDTEAPRVVREGLASAFGVSELFFEPDDAVARQVYEGLRLMSGKVGRIRARGMKTDGLPPGVMSILNDLATEFEKKNPEDE